MMLGFHVAGPDELLLDFWWIIVRLVTIFQKIYRISVENEASKTHLKAQLKSTES
jgi:hypothetical protein